MLDKEKLESVLSYIKDRISVIDSIWCVAGYAYPKKSCEQTPEFHKRHIDRNLTYVQISLDMLKDNMDKSENPLVVTCGSQWTYRSSAECPELTPYIEAKHALRKYTSDFARENPKIRANHYCIPSSDTPSYRRIEENFKAIGKDIMKSHNSLAQPSVIAKSLVEHALSFRHSGQTLVCEPDGLIRVL